MAGALSFALWAKSGMADITDKAARSERADISKTDKTEKRSLYLLAANALSHWDGSCTASPLPIPLPMGGAAY